MNTVVIGGGLLGAELAEVWRHFGLHVTQLVLESWYFQKGLSEPQGRIVEAGMRRHRLDLQLNESVVELQGNGTISKVVTKSGKEFPVDAVGITIGVEPNIELAKASGISTNRGILIDTLFRTSSPHVFAAGDCAEIQTALTDRTAIEQLWYSAIHQGEAVARVMCGDPRPYDPGIFYNAAMFFDVDYVYIGAQRFPEDGQDEETVVAKNGRAARRFIHRNGLLAGISSVGASDDPKRLMNIIHDGMSMSAVQAKLGGRRWPKPHS